MRISMKSHQINKTTTEIRSERRKQPYAQLKKKILEEQMKWKVKSGSDRQKLESKRVQWNVQGKGVYHMASYVVSSK